MSEQLKCEAGATNIMFEEIEGKRTLCKVFALRIERFHIAIEGFPKQLRSVMIQAVQTGAQTERLASGAKARHF